MKVKIGVNFLTGLASGMWKLFGRRKPLILGGRYFGEEKFTCG